MGEAGSGQTATTLPGAFALAGLMPPAATDAWTQGTDRAAVVVTLDADFLQGQPESVRYARDLIAARNPDSGPMNRIYALEDHLGLRPRLPLLCVDGPAWRS
jgi:hypothetical protein